MKTKLTKRNFKVIDFDDYYGQDCSIQKSSIATIDCIWLGVDNTGDELGNKEGTRMHLTRKQAAFLIPILENFVKTGELPSVHKNSNK